MTDEDKRILKAVDILTKDSIISRERSSQNTKAIEDLTKNVDALVKTMAQTDRDIEKSVQELILTQSKCSERFSTMLDRLDTKGVKLKELEKNIETRVEKHIFDRVVNRLWTIGAGVAMVLLGAGGFMMKTIFEGLKNG